MRANFTCRATCGPLTTNATRSFLLGQPIGWASIHPMADSAPRIRDRVVQNTDDWAETGQDVVKLRSLVGQ